MDDEGNYKAYGADGTLESAGTLEPTEEYEGVCLFLLQDKSGKNPEKGAFMDSDIKLHFGNEEGENYLKDKD